MSDDAFTWWDTELEYFDHPYNDTRLNERCVEIPIARHWIGAQHGYGLEVGNVLGHYAEQSERDVLDRYEKAPGVINEDVLVYEPKDAYDWIVSISTVEHVRWNEEPRVWDGGAYAVERMRTMPAPGGLMLVTVGLGQNEFLDGWLLGDYHGAHRSCTFVRDGDGWVQTPEPEWRPYGQEPGWAGSVWIGEWSTA